ncbi:MAG: hypothetical protein SCK70_16385, partial [bacterium]|nr:hypothetical protein [bacterium]
LIVSVKTDAATKYRHYIQVLDQLKQANATRISIAEPERRQQANFVKHENLRKQGENGLEV